MLSPDCHVFFSWPFWSARICVLDDTNIFEISIGDRVLSSEIKTDGMYPVYSANVFEEFGRIDKQNLTDFSVPSIVWGIDGDWMVNVFPENDQFYPTDHCGVLRIKSKEIIPEYFAMALNLEGINEKFSRTNRASVDRIKGLVIPVPPLAEQKKIVAEFAKIDKEIQKETENVANADRAVNDKFAEMFGENKLKSYALRKLDSGDFELFIGDRVVASEIITNGKYPIFSANVYEEFGRIDKQNITDFSVASVLWGIDGD